MRTPLDFWWSFANPTPGYAVRVFHRPGLVFHRRSAWRWMVYRSEPDGSRHRYRVVAAGRCRTPGAAWKTGSTWQLVDHAVRSRESWRDAA